MKLAILGLPIAKICSAKIAAFKVKVISFAFVECYTTDYKADLTIYTAKDVHDILLKESHDRARA